MYRICCVGDIMLGENAHHYRRGIPSKYSGRYHDLISADTDSLINGTEVLIGNFESSLCPDNEYSHLSIEDRSYRAPVSSLGLFNRTECQIVMNVANNHFEQHGDQSTRFSLKTLRDAGILVAGTSSHPTVIESAKRRIFIWGVSLIEDNCESQHTFKATSETLPVEISLKEKHEGDIWIMSIHWGDEYLTLPNSSQKDLSDKLHSMGFDVVVGHHPHVIQPINIGNRKITIFSLGNFIFDQNFSLLTRHGMLCEIELDDLTIRPYITYQKEFAVSTKRTSLEEIKEYCMKKFDRLTPLRMRILMKLELIYNIHKSNIATMKYFASKAFKKEMR